MGTKPLAEPTAQNPSTSRSQEETPPRQLRTRSVQQRSAFSESPSTSEDICSVCQKRFQPSTSRGESSRTGCRCWQAPESSPPPSSSPSRNNQITRASRSKRVRKKLELDEESTPSTSSVQNISTIEAAPTESTELPATTSTSSIPQRRKEQRHVCPVCSKPFGSPGKLGQHMYSHTGERPFQCQHCPKAFSSKFKLVRHVLIHSDERRYRCTACDRTFHRKDHLKNHVKVHSPVKKRFRCERPGCGKEYGSQLSFRKHTAVHSAEDGSLECKMCGKAFNSKEEIVYHLKVHAGSRTVKNPADKKYRCDHCDRRFFTRKDVRRHMVVHTGKRDFLCQFCPQRFGRKDHLVRHIKKSHHNQTTSSSTATEASTPAKRPAKRKELILTPIPNIRETELQPPPPPYSSIILTQFKYEPQSPASPATSDTSVQQTVPTHPSSGEQSQSMIIPFEDILIPGVTVGYDLPTSDDPVSADLLTPLASILAPSSSEDTSNNTAPLPRFNQAFHPQQPP